MLESPERLLTRIADNPYDRVTDSFKLRECKKSSAKTAAAGWYAAATRAAGGRVEAWRGETDIFIYPGYRFRVTDALMTNFHLPKSTLLMLVAALMGQDRMRAAYAHAVAGGYRFFSYGDASLLLPGGR